ncbi:MAG: hypothetical protein ABH891_09350 [Candidatus Omnitrophota bacterium]
MNEAIWEARKGLREGSAGSHKDLDEGFIAARPKLWNGDIGE